MTILVHIGLQKTGTTFLQRHVFSQPNLGFELIWGVRDGWAIEHFVVRDTLDFDPEAVRADFESARGMSDGVVCSVISHEDLSGYPVLGKYYSELAADRLARTFPDAKILIGVREQVSMILSLYGQYVRQGGVHGIRDFLDVSVDRPAFRTICRPQHLDYHRIYRLYESRFGANNIAVLPIELLARDAARYFGVLSEHCGVGEISVSAGPSNERSSRLAQRVELFLNRFIRHPARAAENWRENRLAYRIKKKVVRLTNALPIGDKENDRDRRDLIGHLGGFYAPSNCQLAELTGLDLGALGYRVED